MPSTQTYWFLQRYVLLPVLIKFIDYYLDPASILYHKIYTNVSTLKGFRISFYSRCLQLPAKSYRAEAKEYESCFNLKSTIGKFFISSYEGLMMEISGNT